MTTEEILEDLLRRIQELVGTLEFGPVNATVAYRLGGASVCIHEALTAVRKATSS